MSFIKATNLTMDYGRGEARVTALKGVNIAINRGEFVAVMGPSGSGKSTLLSILGGLSAPTGGSLVVDDIDIYGLSSDRRSDFRREYLGFVFQSFHLVEYLTLAENAMLPLAAKKMAGSEKRKMANLALELVGLSGKEQRLPSQVSGGEQERAAIARAVVNRPEVILADEPTGNLDSETGRAIMELITRLNSEGATVVMVTHSDDCAAYAGRVIGLMDGSLAQVVSDPALCLTDSALKASAV